MDMITGRPNHIEDWICRQRTGQWFGWSDYKNKIYANLVVYDGGSKPTEKECTDGLAQIQAEWDLENDSYRSQRVGITSGYLPLQEQFDQLYRDMKAGKLGVGATTGEWYVGITSVKTLFPKS